MTHEYNAELVRVIDGDTIDVVIDLGFGLLLSKAGKKYPRLRLARIDTPEMRGEAREQGLRSKRRVMELFEEHGDSMVIRTIEKDSFGRWLTEVTLGNGDNLSDVLLHEGFAARYSK